MPPRRILVYGVTGAGKSTLAKRVAARTGLPLYLVDDLTFESNWQPVSDERQRQIFGEIVARDKWILDTAYGKWLDIPLTRASLILCLDYPRIVSLTSLLRRTFHRIATRQPVCNNNLESLRIALSRESIVLWHFKSFSRKRERMRLWAQEMPDRVMLFKSRRQADQWLESLRLD